MQLNPWRNSAERMGIKAGGGKSESCRPSYKILFTGGLCLGSFLVGRGGGGVVGLWGLLFCNCLLGVELAWLGFGSEFVSQGSQDQVACRQAADFRLA